MTDKQAKEGTRISFAGLNVTIPAWLKRAVDWVLGLPKAVLVAAGTAVFTGFVGFVLFLGFEIGHHKVFPSTLFEKVDGKLGRIFIGERPTPKLMGATYNSALIRLTSTVGIVPTGRSGTGNPLSSNGGGLTSFGRDVLVLPYNGKIYAASSADDLRETAIVAPDNNRTAFIAAADAPENADLEFVRTYLRYNDLTYFKTATGHGLLASYTEYHTGKLCVTNTIARLDIDPAIDNIDAVEAGQEDWTIIYRTNPCLPFKDRHIAMEGHMAGGRMVFQAPATVYLTSGDFHEDGMRSNGPGIAQNPDAEYGKVLSIDIDSGESSIVSLGHRNMQGITFAPNGNLLVVEHGPRGGDEINWVRPGLNYGWPLESYGTTYRGTAIPNSISFGRHTQSEPPIYGWVPSIAASAVTTINGFHEAWDGDLLVGSLREGALYRVRLEGDQAIYSERIEIGTRIRDVHQHTDGRLIVWTDNEEVMFFEASERVDDSIIFEGYLTNSDLSSRMQNRLRTAVDGCAECHSFAADDHVATPSLGRIFGDDIAATSFAGYSDGLKNRRGDWSRENLIAFLSDPEAFASGTSMPDPNIEDAKVIEALVDYLEEVDSQF